MKMRVITAVVAITAFIPFLFVLPTWCMGVLLGLLCAVGAWEMLHETKSVGKHLFLYLSCLTAFVVPNLMRSIDTDLFWFLLVAAVYMFLAIACAVFDHEKVTFAAVAKGFMSALIMPLMFSSVLRILNAENGRLLVLIPWITVWICDSFALFTGMACGKHKLAPYVSPKKTIEGAIGGTLAAVVAMGLYVLVMDRGFDFYLELIPMLVFGLLGAIVGQIGDLSLSVIKREVGIKDYGKLFPGHGGVWDRFDSILFAAPLFELIYLHILPRL